MTRPPAAVALAAVLFLASGATGPRGDDGAPGGPIEAVTRPREDVTLAFIYPGKIASLLVAEGDAVQEGMPLVQLDDGPDRIQLSQLEAGKEDDLGVKMAEARLVQKKSQLEQVERAAARQAASPLELEQARLDARLAELTLAREKLDLAQAGRKYEEAKARIERMLLRSSLNGRVEQVFVHVGETVDRLQKVIRVVAVDALRIDVAVPLAQAAGLACGGSATVRFPGPAAEPGAARIVFVQAVADAASETLTVRIEVPNPSGRPAGEHVRVSFP